MPTKNKKATKPKSKDSYQVICDDALEWLKKQPNHSLGNIITGLPDLDEVPMNLAQYILFFKQAIRLCFQKVTRDGYAIFMNTDRKHQGQWIDKSYLISQVASDFPDLKLKWHKIVLLRGVGKAHLQRPTYQHFLCFSYRGKPGAGTADVILCGRKAYPNAACLVPTQLSVQFVKRYSPHSIVVDPFVGRGTILLEAKKQSLKGIGVDIDPKQCRETKQLLGIKT